MTELAAGDVQLISKRSIDDTLDAGVMILSG